MEIRVIFKRLGLDMHAHEVYDALITEREPMLIAHLATRVGVSRAQVYRSLAGLLKEGFVTPSKEFAPLVTSGPPGIAAM